MFTSHKIFPPNRKTLFSKYLVTKKGRIGITRKVIEVVKI